MKRTLAILTPFLFAWGTPAFPQSQYSGTPPVKLYKCMEDGKAVYQEDLCASGPSKPLKKRDTKGVEPPNRQAAEYVPPPPAPVAVIPYTPSKPLANTTMPNSTIPTNTTPTRTETSTYR